MKYSYTILGLLAIMLCFGLTAGAQTAGNMKRLEKDGLAFDYPNGWTLADQSNEDAQQFTLGRAGSDAQIRIFVFRSLVDTPAKVTEAQTKLVNPYVEATAKSFVDMGANPTRTPATIQFGTLPAEGVRIKAVLDSVPGEAAIYWAAIGNRLVVLTLFGPDDALKQAAPAWESVRNSLSVEDKKPTQKTAPK
jgi:hypothetical protein